LAGVHAWPDLRSQGRLEFAAVSHGKNSSRWLKVQGGHKKPHATEHERCRPVGPNMMLIGKKGRNPFGVQQRTSDMSLPWTHMDFNNDETQFTRHAEFLCGNSPDLRRAPS